MLTKKQLSTIMINAITVKMLMTYPHELVSICGNAAWINMIYCVLLALLLFVLTCTVYKSNCNVIDLSYKMGGRLLRMVVGSAVIVVMGLNILSLVRIFPEIIRLVLLQRTYVEIVGTVFMVALIIGARNGIEAIARVHAVFIPIAGIVFAVFIAMLIPSFKLDNIFPIFGKGYFNMFVKGISGISVFSDLLLLNILLSRCDNFEEYKQTGIKAVLISGVSVVMIVSAYCLSYEYPASLKYIAPVYQLERLIYLSNFFSRFEAFFQFVWTISIMLYGSLYLSVIAEVWKTSFDLKSSKPLIMAIAASLIGIAVSPASLNDMIRWESIINKWIFIPAFAIPILIGIAASVRRKR